MRRMLMVLLGGALVAAVLVGTLKIINHDGRSPYEKLEDEAVNEKPVPVSLASCPSVTPSHGVPKDRNRNQPDAVVPDGAVQILVCDYYGFGTDTPRSYDRQEELAKEGRAGGRSIVPSIVRQLQRSKRLTGSGFVGCPNDTGARLLTIFRYRGEPAVPVQVDLSGCRSAGAVGRPAVVLSKPLLLRLLASLDAIWTKQDQGQPSASSR